MNRSRGIKTKKSAKKPRVFVGMSGGVDSSVSAALLQKIGFDVTGVFIKVWHPEFLPCTWKAERLDAMRVCAKLDIPFLTFDFEKEYKKAVVDYMIDEYSAGKTPNPDVMCNKAIKFGAFLEKARALGADYIATGHYARKTTLDSIATMNLSADSEKDQTYFLWTLRQDQLRSVLFPVGGIKKQHVRKLAKQFGLPTASKKDSQGLCFIGRVDFKDFLKHYIKQESGVVLNTKGEPIGTHDGACFYTIGQRHGFTLTQKTTDDKPLYVIEKNMEENTITVSERRKSQKGLSSTKTVNVIEVNWIAGTEPDLSKTYQARIRYRQPLETCKISKQPNNTYTITFNSPQTAVSRGQSVVIYHKTACIGGGIIMLDSTHEASPTKNTHLEV